MVLQRVLDILVELVTLEQSSEFILLFKLLIYAALIFAMLTYTTIYLVSISNVGIGNKCRRINGCFMDYVWIFYSAFVS